MGQKKVKQYKKNLRKTMEVESLNISVHAMKEFVKTVNSYRFRDRVRIAMDLILGRWSI